LDELLTLGNFYAERNKKFGATSFQFCIFVARSSTIECYCHPPLPKKKWKRLSAQRARPRKQNLHFFQFSSSRARQCKFTSTIYKLRSTTGQIPALGFNEKGIGHHFGRFFSQKHPVTLVGDESARIQSPQSFNFAFRTRNPALLVVSIPTSFMYL
jgi:hypothetical protein